MARAPLTVGQLSRRLKSHLEAGFPEVQVLGELSKVFVSGRGHVYLTLKDEEAAVECVCYESTARMLPVHPDVGTLVVARGYPSIFERQTRLQLIVNWLEPAGAGRLQAAYDALKHTLLTEGLFDPARKKALPFLPAAVGVVTSDRGAARRDIEAVVHRRSPQIPVVLSPTRVEGVDAAPDIVRALARLAKRPDVEVIIIGRGGGSMESLWAFNTEIVARAIAACAVPVISAVGHETDVTIADLVADARAATPSAAAELAVPERDTLLHTLILHRQRLDRALRGRLERGEARVDRAVRRLESATRARLNQDRKRIEARRRRLIAAEPSARLARSRARFDAALRQLDQRLERRHRAARDALGLAAARLDALSPLAVLGRGYSITRGEVGVVRDASSVQVGDAVEILLHRGRLSATVGEVHAEED